MASEAAVRELWVRLAEAYGSAFVNQFGDEPSATWRAGLGDLSDEDVAAGCLATIRGDSSFAPNLPEFRRRCVEAARQRIRALPTPGVREVPLECLQPQSLLVLAEAAGIDVEGMSREAVVRALEGRR